jgi:hypothetical protein
MNDDVDSSDDASIPLRIDVLEALSRPLPPHDPSGDLRGRLDPLDSIELLELVAEEVVRDGGDERLLEVWVPREDLLSDEELRHRLARESLVRVLDRDDHRLLATVTLEDVDAVEAELAREGDSVEGGEARRRVLAEEDTGDESLHVLETSVERRERVRLELAVTVEDVGEEAGERRRVDALGEVVVGESPGVAVRVASALLGRQSRGASEHRLEESLLVDEGDLDDRLPVLLLPVQVEGKVDGVEVDDGRGGVGHEVAEGDGDVGGREVGKDSHELLEGVEGASEVKVELVRRSVLKICRRRRQREVKGGARRAWTHQRSWARNGSCRTSPRRRLPSSSSGGPTGVPRCTCTRGRAAQPSRCTRTRASPTIERTSVGVRGERRDEGRTL